MSLKIYKHEGLQNVSGAEHFINARPAPNLSEKDRVCAGDAGYPRLQWSTGREPREEPALVSVAIEKRLLYNGYDFAA